MKFEIEKFYPGPGIEPGPLALRASALPLRHPVQLLIQGRINLSEPILSDHRTTNSVVARSYGGMHSYISTSLQPVLCYGESVFTKEIQGIEFFIVALLCKFWSTSKLCIYRYLPETLSASNVYF